MSISFFGKGENDPGEWVEFGPFRVRVRRITPEKGREIRKRYGKEVFVDKEGARVPQRVQSEDENQAMLLDLASFALTEVERLTLKVEDDEGAKKLKSLLALESVDVGQDVSFDGLKLNDAQRKFLLRDLRLDGPFNADDFAMLQDDPEAPLLKGKRIDLATFFIFQSRKLSIIQASAAEAVQGNL